jgi:hypothetical protein
MRLLSNPKFLKFQIAQPSPREVEHILSAAPSIALGGALFPEGAAASAQFRKSWVTMIPCLPPSIIPIPSL